MDQEMHRVFTLGTGRRSEEDFIEILLFHGIENVVDVRSVPKSKIPSFTQANLIEILGNEGIGYSYRGGDLGGFRKGGFEAYACTDEFRRAVDSLEEILVKGTSAIICSEHFPWKCHRRWISRELHARGWEVIHIIDKGKVWIPK